MTNMESLAHIGLQATKLFRKLDATEKGLSERPKAQFAAEADRLELWAVNLGVFVFGHGSLDYRVRDASGIRDALRRFLASLVEPLKDGD